MSKRANPTVIGAFVVGAIILAVLAVIIFSGGKLFQKRYSYVMYFQSSVKGLNVGSPVTFRGVKVGTVTDMKLVADREGAEPRIPVIAEFEPDSVHYLDGHAPQLTPERTKRIVEKGLRARLQLQSLLTGQLMIELDFHPDEPLVLRGDGKIPEIPTIATSLDKLGKKLEDINFTEIAKNLASVVTAIDHLVGSSGVLQTLEHANRALDAVTQFMQTANTQVQPLSATLLAAEKALATSNDALTQAKKTLVSTQSTMDSTKTLLGKDSDIMFQLSNAIVEISEAARAVRVLAEAMERQPESIFKGKQTTGGR